MVATARLRAKCQPGCHRHERNTALRGATDADQGARTTRSARALPAYFLLDPNNDARRWLRRLPPVRRLRVPGGPPESAAGPLDPGTVSAPGLRPGSVPPLRRASRPGAKGVWPIQRGSMRYLLESGAPPRTPRPIGAPYFAPQKSPAKKLRCSRWCDSPMGPPISRHQTDPQKIQPTQIGVARMPKRTKRTTRPRTNESPNRGSVKETGLKNPGNPPEHFGGRPPQADPNKPGGTLKRG